MMKEKLEEINRHISTLSHTIKDMEEMMKDNDICFLKVWFQIMDWLIDLFWLLIELLINCVCSAEVFSLNGRWVICWFLWSLCFWSKSTAVLILNVLSESRSHHSRIPQTPSRALIHVPRYLGNLPFRVWRKMQDIVQSSETAKYLFSYTLNIIFTDLKSCCDWSIGWVS